MAAIPRDSVRECDGGTFGPHGLVTEAWGQGFMMGAIIILLALTIANMRRGAILHKLILTELILASLHGTFIFVHPPVFGWYMSSTAALLYISYNLHNVVNWIKVKPFLPRWGSLLYIDTVALACPYWIAAIYLNFAYNNTLGNDVFRQTRPWEALFREPWWIFTSFYLVYIIKRCYGVGVLELARISARFGVLLAAMAVSVACSITDIVEVAVFPECAGRNPYWKLALVFKFTADSVFLDDFKAILDQLTARTMQNLACTLPPIDPNPASSTAGDTIAPRRSSSQKYPQSSGYGNFATHIEDPELGEQTWEPDFPSLQGYGIIAAPPNVHRNSEAF